jgi:peroxiredoxin Q/BCP
VCAKYGVIKDKNMYGKIFKGIERSTFVIDADGKVAKIYRKVKVAGHVANVLEDL